MRRPIAAALCLAGSMGCVDSTGPPHPLLEETEFAPELGVDLASMRRIGGGIYVGDITPGEGTAVESDHRVRVAYDLFVPDGRHVLRRDDARFQTGCRDVVLGLEAGIYGMRVGGTRRIVVPVRLGYGESPPWGVDVPPYSILIYVVELTSTAPTINPCPAQ